MNQHDVIRNQLKIREIRRVERIFVYHRWLYAVAIAIVAYLYRPIPLIPIGIILIWLCLSNLLCWRLSKNLKTVSGQTALSLFMLVVDGLASWGLMILFVHQPAAVIYAVFTLIIIEGAVRFSFIGSILSGVFFIIGLSAAWILRVVRYGMDFNYQEYVFWVGLITLLSIMVGMAIREGRKQRAYAEILAMDRTRLLERRRISSELHDTVLKSLQGLALEAYMLMKTAERNQMPPVEEKARFIEEVCKSMSQEIRSVVLDIRDDDMRDTPNITAQLKTIVENWSASSGIAIETVFEGNLPTLSHKMSHDLRQIAGEALMNIKRHSGATRAKLSLIRTDRALQLIIEDNGHGFDCLEDNLYLLAKTGKLGLVSLKERAETSGGELALSSNDSGTTVTVSIPMSKISRQASGIK